MVLAARGDNLIMDCLEWLVDKTSTFVSWFNGCYIYGNISLSHVLFAVLIICIILRFTIKADKE